MTRPSLAFCLLLIAGVSAGSQSFAQSKNQAGVRCVADSDQQLASRAVNALQRLDQQVLIYHSLGEFESDGRLARVSPKIFGDELQATTAEVSSLLEQMPVGKLRSSLANALDSFNDGFFWWRQIDQPRVINVSALAADDVPLSANENAFLSTVPYTVAIHFRQAHKYLDRSVQLMGEADSKSIARHALR